MIEFSRLISVTRTDYALKQAKIFEISGRKLKTQSHIVIKYFYREGIERVTTEHELLYRPKKDASLRSTIRRHVGRLLYDIMYNLW